MIPKDWEQDPNTLKRIWKKSKDMKLPKRVNTLDDLVAAAKLQARIEIVEELKTIWPTLLAVKKNPQLTTLLAIIIEKLQESFGDLSRFAAISSI